MHPCLHTNAGRLLYFSGPCWHCYIRYIPAIATEHIKMDKIPHTVPTSQQPTTLASLLHCRAGSTSRSSPKSALQEHQKQVGNKLVDLRERGKCGEGSRKQSGLKPCVQELGSSRENPSLSMQLS